MTTTKSRLLQQPEPSVPQPTSAASKQTVFILHTGPTGMICPKCKDHDLKAANVRGIEVDRCVNCDGIWFDKDELAAVLDLDRKVRHTLQSRKEDTLRDQIRGECPRDAARLARMYSAQAESVVLDVCPTCSGIWLDAGELSRLSK